jgi:hypothetical protein
VEGKIQATYVGNNTPFGGDNNSAGEYKFAMTDQDGNKVTGKIEYAYSVAQSAGDASCLHITAENHKQFTYTDKDCFTIMEGTLCVAAISKDADGNVLMYANATFDIKTNDPNVEKALLDGAMGTDKKPAKKKGGLFSMLRRKTKKAAPEPMMIENNNSNASIPSVPTGEVAAVDASATVVEIKAVEVDIVAVTTGVAAADVNLSNNNNTNMDAANANNNMTVIN